MPSEIKYNGETIAVVEEGQTAVLECKGYTMRDNVRIAMGYGGISLSEFKDVVDASVAEAMRAANESGAFKPVKGVDYYTTEDKTEIVASVLASLPTWSGGSY